MKLVLLLVLFVLAGTATRPAHALPPPWELEIQKAKADLVLLATTGTPMPCRTAPGTAKQVTLKPLVVLKGKVSNDNDDKKALRSVVLVYTPPEDSRALRRGFAGGPVDPAVKKDETALVFLKRDPKGHHYRCVAGVIGYIVLQTATHEQLTATVKRLQTFREVCEHIQDTRVRKQMEAWYRQAEAYARKLAEPPRGQ